jgi:hypothetical protein
MTSFLDALIPLVDVFETYDVDYYIGGSVATIAHGVPRTTLDVDVIAEIYPHQVHVLVTTLQHDFYIQAIDIHDAIIQRSSFNIVHFASMIKIDIFWHPIDHLIVQKRNEHTIFNLQRTSIDFFTLRHPKISCSKNSNGICWEHRSLNDNGTTSKEY